MMPAEKEELLALFDHKSRWCQDAEARDSDGSPVAFDDVGAVAWDLTGALCRLFGWQRAQVLFGQLERHVKGTKRRHWYNRSPEIEAMVGLQKYNDRADMTFDLILGQLGTMPIWQGKKDEVERA